MVKKAAARPVTLASKIDKLLSPWRFRKAKLLGGSVLEPMVSEPLGETLWCKWDPFEDEWESVMRGLECLELLGLVAQIDTTIFRSLATELFDYTIDEKFELVYTRIGVACELSEYLDLQELSVMFGWDTDGETAREGDEQSGPTPQFEAAK